MFGDPDPYAMEVEGIFLARCVNDEWPPEMRRCLLSTTSLTDPKNCKAKLTLGQGAMLDADLAQAERHERGRELPKACLDLEVQVAVAMSCEAIPQAERDRIKKQLAITKAGWDKVIDKQLLAPTCGAAIAALRQATSECKLDRAPDAPKQEAAVPGAAK